MVKKYRTVQLEEQTKSRLAKVCEITNLNQNKLLSMVIDKIWENCGQYKEASILVDDSTCRVTSNIQNIVIEVRGLIPSSNFEHGTKRVDEE